MSDAILDRILRDAGAPDLLEILVERLSASDLQSLLLAVYRRRAASLTPSHLLDQYARDRFVRPSALAPQVLATFERLAWATLPAGYAAVELSPICPLGTNSAVATVSQDKVVTTVRNSEVVADVTNALALECAARRHAFLRATPTSRERVRLGASQRVVRGQTVEGPGSFAHFRLLGLCVAGRDEGSFAFEITSLVEQIEYYLHLLRAATALGYTARAFRVALTDLADGRRTRLLSEQTLAPLAARHPETRFEMDPDRAGGRGYYVGACFHIYATTAAGEEFELIDGGFTTWTQQLLNNRKERLLISGLGVERFCAQFRSDESGPILTSTT